LRRGENQVLASLSEQDFERGLPHLELVRLDLHEILYRTGARVDFVFFPLTCLLSMITELKDGSKVESTTIGFNATTGTPLAPPGAVSAVLLLAQIPGEAMRMPATAFRRWLQQSPDVRDQIDRCSQALLVTVAQTAACNKLHQVEQRCARWLLMTHDGVRDDTFPMTHEFLATMLGVRRASVTSTALELQNRGLIKYRRGQMEIIDRMGLEQASCECYEVVVQRQKQIMSN
jgi:CRP-like cAMP-binding protein